MEMSQMTPLHNFSTFSFRFLNLKKFENSRPSTSNFKSHYVGQNNFGNRIPFLNVPTYTIYPQDQEN